MNSQMKARIALAGYWLSLGFLVACAGVIVMKLIFWPICTTTAQSACAVGDSWTIAGVTASVLGVAATVLAILGAMAVAVWWTGLEERVSKQISTLYAEQKEELYRIRKAMIYLRLGDRLLSQRLTNDALFNYQKAREFLKDDAELNFVLGYTLNDEGEYGSAITMLEACNFTDPAEQAKSERELGLAYRHRWEALKHDEDIERAEEHLKKAADLDRKNSDTFTVLGGLYRRKNDFEQALYWYNRALQVGRRSSYTLGHIATLLWYLGREDEAQVRFRETGTAALSHIDEDPPEVYWFYYDLGLAQLASGDITESRKSYLKAARTTPGKAQFDAILEDLYLLQHAPHPMAYVEEIISILEEGKRNK